MKNQYRIKNLPDPISTRQAASKNYVDNFFNDPSIKKNNAHIDLNDRNSTNAMFIQVNQLPQIDSHLTVNLYVDNAIHQQTVVRNNQDNDFSIYNLTKTNSITLNKQAENDNEVITKAYVDEFHQENERSRREVGLDFYDESNDLVKNNQDNDLNDNKLTNLDSVQVNRLPPSDNELESKKHFDESIGEGTLLRFNQTLQNYLKVSVGNDKYNLAKNDKTPLIDITEIRFPNMGYDLLPKWKIENLHKINGSIASHFIKSTTTSSPIGESGASNLPPIGSAYMYIETSSNNYGHEKVFVSWEKTDIIQFSNITFYYNRFSLLINDNLKSMGRFRIQSLLEDNTWSTVYTIDEHTQFNDNSTDWSLLNFNFTQENYGMKLIYDQIDTPHADMCFSNITTTHSV